MAQTSKTYYSVQGGIASVPLGHTSLKTVLSWRNANQAGGEERLYVLGNMVKTKSRGEKKVLWSEGQ